MAVSSQVAAVLLILLFETLFCFLFGFFFKYDTASTKKESKGNSTNSTHSNKEASSAGWDSFSYEMFMDVQMMIFVGFGFIVTFLRRYGFSALGFSFLISVLVIQVEMISRGLYKYTNEEIPISVNTIIRGEVAAATVLISIGTVLGKTSLSQLVFMAFVETLFYDLNIYINEDILKAVDPGGSLYVHVFGAYFGLAVGFILWYKQPEPDDEDGMRASSYRSDLFSMIGNIFLWICWPSFLAALQPGDCRYRTVINTYLALLSSCAITFAMTLLFGKGRKMEMAHIQNATLAGGVGVGAVCNMVIEPFGAILVGGFSALACILGFKYVQGFLRNKLSIDDVCGVHNLHALPGFVGGVLAVIMAAIATKDTYGDSFATVFPAMSPPDDRGAGAQAGIQVALIGITVGISIIGGLLTGVFARYVFTPVPADLYSDDVFYNTPVPRPP